jgi:GAF domain-containing protein
MSTPMPRNERQRLAQLLSVGLLDTPPSEGFDRICFLARELFGVPASMVSFVDANRQWFKSRSGTTLTGSSRSVSFCSHTILQDEILVVSDARRDPRFANSPLVTGPEGIRFYAGAPIMLTPGLGIGAVCIVDHAPRRLDRTGRAVLKHLAGMALTEIRLLLAARTCYQQSDRDPG